MDRLDSIKEAVASQNGQISTDAAKWLIAEIERLKKIESDFALMFDESNRQKTRAIKAEAEVERLNQAIEEGNRQEGWQRAEVGRLRNICRMGWKERAEAAEAKTQRRIDMAEKLTIYRQYQPFMGVVEMNLVSDVDELLSEKEAEIERLKEEGSLDRAAKNTACEYYREAERKLKIAADALKKAYLVMGHVRDVSPFKEIYWDVDAAVRELEIWEPKPKALADIEKPDEPLFTVPLTGERIHERTEVLDKANVSMRVERLEATVENIQAELIRMKQ